MNGSCLLIERRTKSHFSVANMDALVDDSLLPARVLGRVLALSAAYVHRRHTLDAPRSTLPHIRRRARLGELLERVRKHYSDNGMLLTLSREAISAHCRKTSASKHRAAADYLHHLHVEVLTIMTS